MFLPSHNKSQLFDLYHILKRTAFVASYSDNANFKILFSHLHENLDILNATAHWSVCHHI